MTDQKEWKSLAMAQSEVIGSLSDLCRELIWKLSQYTDIKNEEERLKKMEGKG